MPRFFFDCRDGDRLIRDDEGLVIDTVEEARHEAARALGEMARDALPDDGDREMSIDVRDEKHASLFRVALWVRVEQPADPRPVEIRSPA